MTLHFTPKSLRPPQPPPPSAVFPAVSPLWTTRTPAVRLPASWLFPIWKGTVVRLKRLLSGGYHRNYPQPTVVSGSSAQGAASQGSQAGPTFPCSPSPGCSGSDLTTLPTSLPSFDFPLTHRRCLLQKKQHAVIPKPSKGRNQPTLRAACSHYSRRGIDFRAWKQPLISRPGNNPLSPGLEGQNDWLKVTDHGRSGTRNQALCLLVQPVPQPHP